jgi:aspartate racemase
MAGHFYADVFEPEGITIVLPSGEEQAFVDDKYFAELVNAVFLPETRLRILEIVARMRERDRIDGVILAGTELPLALRDAGVDGVRFLDTTAIHVRAIVSKMLE